MIGLSLPVITWLLFAARDLKLEEFSSTEIAGKSIIALADGRSISGIPVEFSEEGTLNIYDLAEECPEPATGLSVLVGTCDCPQETTLRIGLGADWKFRFYLNGKLLCDTFSCANGETIVAPWNHTVEATFAAGRNVMIYQIYGGDRRADVAFKTMERRETALRFGPWPQFPSHNEMSIAFTSTRPTAAGVAYRVKGAADWMEVDDCIGGQLNRDKAVHVVRLKNLLPNTVYEYQALLYNEDHSEEGLAPIGPIQEFTTAPTDDSDYSFVATGDLQYPKEVVTDFFQQMFGREKKADFFVYLGDAVWNSNFEKEYIQDLLLPAFRAGAPATFVPVRGNHERYGRDSASYFKYFTSPAPGREGYGIFRWGNTCFLRLDFCDDKGTVPAPSTRAFHRIEPYLDEEEEWLKQIVQTSAFKDAKYRVVLAHGLPAGDWEQYMPQRLRKMIEPLFGGSHPAYPIHLWLGGHVHYALRTMPGEQACRATTNPALLCRRFPEGWKEAEGPLNFPVCAVSGPRDANAQEFQMTYLTVYVTKQRLTVISKDKNGNCYDKFSVTPEGEFVEEFSSGAFPLYRWP